MTDSASAAMFAAGSIAVVVGAMWLTDRVDAALHRWLTGPISDPRDEDEPEEDSDDD